MFVTPERFNPRAREGRDLWSPGPSQSSSGFNPRAREGRDGGARTGDGHPGSFNPRAREGRDAACFARSSSFCLFQSTRPRGARLRLHKSLKQIEKLDSRREPRKPAIPLADNRGSEIRKCLPHQKHTAAANLPMLLRTLPVRGSSRSEYERSIQIQHRLRSNVLDVPLPIPTQEIEP